MAEQQAVATAAEGVCLRRLLRIARLTPEQAHFLGREIVATLASAPVSGPDLGSVFVNQHGETVVRDAAEPTGLAHILTTLAETMEAEHPYGERLRLAAAAAAAGSAPSALLSILDEVQRAPERPLAEIAALVRTATGRRPPGAQTTAGPSQPALLAQPRRIGLRSVLRPLWRAAAALAVLAAAVFLEFFLLHDRLTNDVHLLLGAPKPAPQASVTPGEPMLPVPAPAPAAAGAVSGVELRAMRLCNPGSGCGVTLLVHLAPAKAVRWEFEVIDRCTGARTTVPGGAVPVGSGDTELSVVAQVPLPPAKALAVFAVTDAPDRATGAPLLAGGTSC